MEITRLDRVDITCVTRDNQLLLNRCGGNGLV
jgi:hypothetical protein